MQIQRQTQLMSMPCSGQTDEWSKELAVLEPGQTLRVYGSLFNTRGNLWYETSREGQRCFLYAGHVKLLEPEPVRSWWQRLLGIRASQETGTTAKVCGSPGFSVG